MAKYDFQAILISSLVGRGVHGLGCPETWPGSTCFGSGLGLKFRPD